MSPLPDTPRTTPLQPLLNDAAIVLRAPTQVWSARSGDIGAAPIDGVYHGDVRHVRAVTVSSADSEVEWISTSSHGAERIVWGGLLRGVDDPTPDPKVRLTRDRRVAAGTSPKRSPSCRVLPSRSRRRSRCASSPTSALSTT